MAFCDVPEPGTGRFTILHEPKGVQFGFLGDSEIKKLSVRRIVSPVAFDGLNNPLEGGLYDPAMGPYDRDHGACPTCGLRESQCPGHLGHIELAVPVYQPLVFTNMYRLLRMTCFTCCRLRHSALKSRQLKVKLLLLEADMLDEVSKLEAILARAPGAVKSSSYKSKPGETDPEAVVADRALLQYEAAALDRLNAASQSDAARTGHAKRTSAKASRAMSQHARAMWLKAVDDFIAKVPNACENCGTRKATIRKDGYSKIFIRHKEAGGGGSRAANAAIARSKALLKGGEDDDDENSNASGTDEDDDDDDGANVGKELYMPTMETRAHLAKVWSEEIGVVSRIWGRRVGEQSPDGYKVFFMNTLPVPASRFRPPARMSGMQFEHPQNQAMQAILKLDESIRRAFEATEAEDSAAEQVAAIQDKQKKMEQKKHTLIKGGGKESKGDGSDSDSGADSDSDSAKSKEEDAGKDPAVALEEAKEAQRALATHKMQNALGLCIELQGAVNAFLDSTKSPTKTDVPGLRQGIEKKEGLFRQNMMGKRVNYAARSVISPDPYIDTDEIGLPVRFAVKLSYPEPVTPWNARELADAVRNGAKQHPGALFIEDEDGRMIDLSRQSRREREDLALQLQDSHSVSLAEEQTVRAARFQPGMEDGMYRREHNKQHAPLSLRRQKKIWRHARSGDVMLANRQPTLHKPSLMAHKVRVINNMSMQTIRMHYANCNSYNADFDGDEINLHLPQSELCRAEAYEIAFTNHQYCSTTDGEPLRGLIQDHVGMGVMLTKQDTFLTKQEYTQMLATACAGIRSRSSEIKLLPPAILKPRQLWTGKQVISSIIMHLVGTQEPSELLSMHPRKTKIPPAAWRLHNIEKPSAHAAALIGPEDGVMGQTKVVVRQGHLCTGVLDKSQFGASKLGLVHSVYELYGPNAAGELLSAFGRVFTFCAQKWGHTCAIEDLLLNRKAETFRTKAIAASEAVGVKLSADFAGLEDEAKATNEEVAAALEHRIRVIGTDDDEAVLDSAMQGVTSRLTTEIIEECLPKGQRKPFPNNCFSLMVHSGAKGSLVNHSQVSCALGQQALEGRRVPRSIAGKSLPCFSAFDPTPRAGGYVSDRFLTGVRPQEYYFHCMAGREGLIDTAVKTANSGYLQRCLIKHMENVSVAYDRTVRQGDGSVLQFMYGGDGLDALNTCFLDGSKETLGFLYANVPALVKKLRVGSGPGELDLSKDADDSVLETNEARELYKLIKRTRKKAAKMASSGQLPIFQGCYVAARRPKRLGASGNSFEEAMLEPGLHRATVLAAYRETDTVDLKFHKDGAEVSRVPIKAGTRQIVFGRSPDPLMSELSPDRHLGAISESLLESLDKYITSNPHGLLEDAEDELTLQQLVWLKYLRALAAPGENVGVIAAQSIGEPSTQMTLNTFHLAGHGAGNVTLGIPRLRELLMTASKTPKTPSMRLPLRPGTDKKTAEKIKASMYCLRLSELLRAREGGVRVVETLRRVGPDGSISQGRRAAKLSRTERGRGKWVRDYNIEFVIQPMKVVRAEFGLSEKQIGTRVARALCPLLIREISKELRRSTGKTLKKSSKGQQSEKDDEEAAIDAAANSKANDSEDEDAEEKAEAAEAGEAGENSTLRLGRRMEVDGYDDDEEEDENSDSDAEGPPATASAGGAAASAADEEDAAGDMAALSLVGSATIGGQRVHRLAVPNAVSMYSAFVGVTFSEESPDGTKPAKVNVRLRLPADAKKLLLVGIAEFCAKGTIVRSVEDITASYVVEGKGEDAGKLSITTDGCNLRAAWEMSDTVDLNRLYSNHVQAMLETYGVEAARAAIVQEVKNVFGVYGIGVDPRHLGLVADYMTFEGNYRALNRTGMKTVTSPFVRMTFESSATFLTAAALEGETDALDSASGRLVMGQLMKTGTGSFQLRVPAQTAPAAGDADAAPTFRVGADSAKKAKKKKKRSSSITKHELK